MSVNKYVEKRYSLQIDNVNIKWANSLEIISDSILRVMPCRYIDSEGNLATEYDNVLGFVSLISSPTDLSKIYHRDAPKYLNLNKMIETYCGISYIVVFNESKEVTVNCHLNIIVI